MSTGPNGGFSRQHVQETKNEVLMFGEIEHRTGTMGDTQMNTAVYYKPGLS